MEYDFFTRPILNSPYDYPGRHWELVNGQPTQHILETRRAVDFITPIPRPRKVRLKAQQSIVFDEGHGLSSDKQQYRTADTINRLRHEVDRWRLIPDPGNWKVTPETARLLQHWRQYVFSGIRPFFCQLEAVETAIWLHRGRPKSRQAGRLLPRLPG